MREDLDPVERALMCLRSNGWTGESHKTQLQEKLMREFGVHRSMYGIGKRGLLIAALAVLVVGSVGLAAAGIRGWLATTEINGKVVDTREVVLDEHGVTTFQVPAQEARQATITLQGDGSNGGGEVTVNVAVNPDGANVEVKQTKPNADE